MNTMISHNAIREGVATDAAERATGACTYRWTDRVRDLGVLGTGMRTGVKQPATSGTPFAGAAAGFVADAAAGIAETDPGTTVWSPPT